MKLGIMQPYIFPYIGYFQLVNAVDRFVVYDDVAYIKQGWINRNQLLLNGTAFMFTVPLKNASSFTTIAETEINRALYQGWKNKFLKTLEQAYSKAPYYAQVADLVTSVFSNDCRTISDLATKSILATSFYLGIDTEFVLSATQYTNNDLKAKDRVIDICKREHADVYINPIGGKEIYARDDFDNAGLSLNFIRARGISYKQFSNDFVPWLSIIDVMMFNSPETIKGFLNEYDLE